MGSINLSNGHSEAPCSRGAHRGERGRGGIPTAASIPTTDYDFQSNNQRFDKMATAQEHPALQSKPAAPAENISVTEKILRTGTLNALNLRRINFITPLNHSLTTSPRTRTR